MELSAAIDFSTDMACLAASALDKQEVLFSESKKMPGKDASAIASWTVSVLARNGFSVCDIRRWTCGSGPGSFTGLRIAASLVSGISFRNDKTLARCVPSGQAIASKIDPDTTNTLVLYDGRRGEIFAFSTPNAPRLNIVTSANLAILDAYARLAAMESQRKAIELILPRGQVERVSYLSEFPVERLLAEETTHWVEYTDSNPLGARLIYLRPPT